MSYKVEVAVVGAGVVGAAVAHLLAAQGREVFVLEQNPGIARGENQSSRNSGVIHAGLYYDRATRPLKARLCPRGNQLLYDFCRAHAVPHLACGKLVVAVAPPELAVLELYAARAREYGVPVELLDAAAARDREPLVRSVGALWCPTSGIVDPTALVHRLCTLAERDGAQFLPGTRVTGLARHPEGVEVTITYRDGAQDRFLAARVVNAAGLAADEVALLLNPASPWRVDPMRGEARCFQRGLRPELALAGCNVYPTPRQVRLAGGVYWTVGVHLTPTLETTPAGETRLSDTVTVGPLNFSARHKEDFGGDLRPAAEFLAEVAAFCPSLREEDLKPYQAGVQARLAGAQDWVLTPEPTCPACLHLLGLDSPALTSCLALAERVREMLG
ncbi:MAG: FAD-dependent oxidoreductase [Deltaproteobacteria bacterium]|nr:FAD-dependent oxidoreductase [Deltaproteobacteria bacterium]